MYFPAQNITNEYKKKVIQDRNNQSTVDPRVQFTQPPYQIKGTQYHYMQ